MSDLRPCAHCGSTDIVDEDCSNMQTNGTRLVCNGCGVMVEGYGGSTCTARAAAKWNARASDAQAEKLAGLLRESAVVLLSKNAGHQVGMSSQIDAALAAYDAGRKSNSANHQSNAVPTKDGK